MTRPGLLIVLSGPSGVGKSTLLSHLVGALPDAVFSVSATTRAMRPGEQDGVNYDFFSPEEFQARVARGEFLEHAEVYGHRYGTRWEPIWRSIAQGKLVLMDIDVQGARSVVASGLPSVRIFLLPPSLPVLQQRLSSRGQDSPQVIDRRMALAREQIEGAREFPYVVVNDQRDAAARAVELIIRWELHQLGRQDCGLDEPAARDEAEAWARGQLQEAQRHRVEQLLRG